MPFVSCWVVGATPSQLMALLPLLRASAASLGVAHKVTQGKPTADTDTAASAAAAAAAAAANDDTGDDNRTCSSVAVLSLHRDPASPLFPLFRDCLRSIGRRRGMNPHIPGMNQTTIDMDQLNHDNGNQEERERVREKERESPMTCFIDQMISIGVIKWPLPMAK